MGRFAEIVGINVKGSVRLELEKRELVAGEVLRDVAYVNMHAPVQAEGLCVALWYIIRSPDNAVVVKVAYSCCLCTCARQFSTPCSARARAQGPGEDVVA